MSESPPRCDRCHLHFYAKASPQSISTVSSTKSDFRHEVLCPQNLSPMKFKSPSKYVRLHRSRAKSRSIHQHSEPKSAEASSFIEHQTLSQLNRNSSRLSHSCYSEEDAISSVQFSHNITNISPGPLESFLCCSQSLDYYINIGDNVDSSTEDGTSNVGSFLESDTERDITTPHNLSPIACSCKPNTHSNSISNKTFENVITDVSNIVQATSQESESLVKYAFYKNIHSCPLFCNVSASSPIILPKKFWSAADQNEINFPESLPDFKTKSFTDTQGLHPCVRKLPCVCNNAFSINSNKVNNKNNSLRATSAVTALNKVLKKRNAIKVNSVQSLVPVIDKKPLHSFYDRKWNSIGVLHGKELLMIRQKVHQRLLCMLKEKRKKNRKKPSAQANEVNISNCKENKRKKCNVEKANNECSHNRSCFHKEHKSKQQQYETHPPRLTQSITQDSIGTSSSKSLSYRQVSESCSTYADVTLYAKDLKRDVTSLGKSFHYEGTTTASYPYYHYREDDGIEASDGSLSSSSVTCCSCMILLTHYFTRSRRKKHSG